MSDKIISKYKWNKKEYYNDFFSNHSEEKGRIHYKINEKYGSGFEYIYPICDYLVLSYGKTSDFSFELKASDNFCDDEIFIIYKILKGRYFCNTKAHYSLLVDQGTIVNMIGPQQLISSNSMGGPLEYIGLGCYWKELKEYLTKIEFDENLLKRYLSCIASNNGLILYFDYKTEQIMDEILVHIKNNNNYLIKIKSQELLYYALTNCYNKVGNNKFYSNENIESVRRVKAFLDENWKENYTLDFLSKKFFINLTYLKEIFKLYYDISPHRYVKLLRLSKAKILIESTDMKITEIANEVGYESASKFSKSFKEYYDNLPSFYRK